MALSSAGIDHQSPKQYEVNCVKSRGFWNALVDRGANGCIAGGDMTVIEISDNSIDLSGIDDHTIRNLKLVKAGGVTKSSHGDIIIIIEQAAHMPDGKTIISCGQLEHFKVQVEEKSKTITGRTPCITTLEGYKIPMATK